MPELDDHELLTQYVRGESEAAFTALVARHVNLVYSAALRFTGNAHHAQEITQAVFIILTRKAGSLRRDVVLSGWLYQTARLTAANFVKGEIRRQRREQEAYMQSTLNGPDAAAWEQIAPLLDEAMGRLGETDRNAVVLRFFANKTAQEVGAALKLTEAAAHKRVSRALGKLRKFFTKRGVTLTAALIAGAVSANSVQAAPAGLAAAVAATAAKGTLVSATIATLVKGTMKTMTWLKIKFAAGAGVVALAAGGVATVAISQTRGGDELAPAIIKKSQDTYASLSSYSDGGKTVSTLGNTAVAPHLFTIKLARPNLYRIEWKQDLGFHVQQGIAWSSGDGDFLWTGGSAQKQKDRETVLAGATGISGSAAASIPGTFFKMNWGNQLGPSIRSAKRKADEKVGDVDCYVLTQERGGRRQTLWIGKQDFLIHQIENVTSAKILKAALEADAKKRPEIRAMLQRRKASGQPLAQESKSVETHMNIVVNKAFSPSDFVR